MMQIILVQSFCPLVIRTSGGFRLNFSTIFHVKPVLVKFPEGKVIMHVCSSEPWMHIIILLFKSTAIFRGNYLLSFEEK